MPAIIIILIGLWILTIAIAIFWKRAAKEGAWWRAYYKADRDKANTIIHNHVKPLRFHIFPDANKSRYWCTLEDDSFESIRLIDNATCIFFERSHSLEDMDKLKEKATELSSRLNKEPEFIIQTVDNCGAEDCVHYGRCDYWDGTAEGCSVDCDHYEKSEVPNESSSVPRQPEN